MTLLLIIPAWLVVLSVIVGLCYAARLGDADGRAELRALDREHPAERLDPSPSGSREARPVAAAKEASGGGALIAA